MGTQGFYRGTSHDQVPFFANKEKKMIESRRWPAEFEQEVDMAKVNIEAVTVWITKRITEILGFEDDIVVDYCKQQLTNAPAADAAEGASSAEKVCPKKLQINLTGFLAKNASRFVKELWTLLLSAQTSPGGVPEKLLEAKKTELLVKQEEAQKLKDFSLSIQKESTQQSTRTTASRFNDLVPQPNSATQSHGRPPQSRSSRRQSNVRGLLRRVPSPSLSRSPRRQGTASNSVSSAASSSSSSSVVSRYNRRRRISSPPPPRHRWRSPRASRRTPPDRSRRIASRSNSSCRISRHARHYHRSPVRSRMWYEQSRNNRVSVSSRRNTNRERPVVGRSRQQRQPQQQQPQQQQQQQQQQQPQQQQPQSQQQTQQQQTQQQQTQQQQTQHQQKQQREVSNKKMNVSSPHNDNETTHQPAEPMPEQLKSRDIVEKKKSPSTMAPTEVVADRYAGRCYMDQVGGGGQALIGAAQRIVDGSITLDDTLVLTHNGSHNQKESSTDRWFAGSFKSSSENLASDEIITSRKRAIACSSPESSDRGRALKAKARRLLNRTDNKP